MYYSAEEETLRVDFGNDTYLTFRLKQTSTVEQTQRMAHLYGRADMVERRRTTLAEKAKNPDLPFETWQAVVEELDKLEKMPSTLTLMVDYILETCQGWEDFFVAEGSTELMPFDRETVGKIRHDYLLKVIGALNKRFGFEAEEKKES